MVRNGLLKTNSHEEAGVSPHAEWGDGTEPGVGLLPVCG